MSYPDLFVLTEAQRRAEQFEDAVERAQLLAQAPRGKSWRYRAAVLLLQSATRLEPQLNIRPSRNPC